jgi:hypothetical protein
MQIKLSHSEAVEICQRHLSEEFDGNIAVEIAVCGGKETTCVSYDTQMVQNLWISSVEPVQTHKEYWPLKIALIKIYRNLHEQLTGSKVDLIAAKKFVEDHTRH